MLETLLAVNVLASPLAVLFLMNVPIVRLRRWEG